MALSPRDILLAISFTLTLIMLERCIAGFVQCGAAGTCPW